jgi:hypothetical protein
LGIKVKGEYQLGHALRYGVFYLSRDLLKKISCIFGQCKLHFSHAQTMPLLRHVCILQSSWDALVVQTLHITKLWKAWEFKILENIYQMDACRFFKLLNVLNALPWKSKSVDDTTKKNIDFLLSLTTNNQCSPQVSL